MADFTVTDVTAAQYAEAETALLALLRAQYPHLDLRDGTALRELLVRPGAFQTAVMRQEIIDAARRGALKGLVDAGDATAEEAALALSNFGLVPAPELQAKGTVIVRVSRAARYAVPAGASFETYDGAVFASDVEVTADVDSEDTPVVADGAGGWYFTLAVTAVEPGTAGNIAAGTALSKPTSLYGAVSCAAYTGFTGGSGGEALAEAAARVPTAITHRAFSSRAACEAAIRDAATAAGFETYGVSVQGYGDPAMIRSRHNALGVDVGGRVDIYARTFTAPPEYAVTVDGVRMGAGQYRIVVTGDDAAGAATVVRVADAAGAVGSYSFTETRELADADGHDVVSSDPAEWSGSALQNVVVTATGVPGDALTKTFTVTLLRAPGIGELQTAADTSSVTQDVIVRAPAVIRVAVTGYAYVGVAGPTGAVLADAVTAKINDSGFAATLSRSELVAALLDAGAVKVGLGDGGLTITAAVTAANGSVIVLTGDEIGIGAGLATVGLTAESCVFTASAAAVSITAVPVGAAVPSAAPPTIEDVEAGVDGPGPVIVIGDNGAQYQLVVYTDEYGNRLPAYKAVV